ncbi:MAG: shikimate dehydrogenase [Rhodospirillaceae bacterium]|jgi:shikimate dehydrogenase|nr:shikimate dehydrogenase [Rhodospirillaceae bacterium]|tara:strand:+ start:10180 stop:11028 length:849 start_codon:yes stop_codon:yes gene_type:complete
MTESGKTIQAGVMGWPVSHSLSPRLHGFWLKERGIDGTYIALAVAPEDLEDSLRSLPERGFAGVNLTLPHKETAADIVDSLDSAATRIGAVNTVVVGADGSLAGSNTDGYGFMENLKSGAPEWTADNSTAVVLGAGGAARAIVAALLDAGVKELRLVNRTQSRAASLKDNIGGAITVVSWADRTAALEGAGLLVNTTTLGMTGEESLEIHLSLLPAEAIVTDIVYIPLTTPLLKNAAERGNPTVDGLGMLLYQARPGFHQWFGAEPAVTEALRAHVLEGLER